MAGMDLAYIALATRDTGQLSKLLGEDLGRDMLLEIGVRHPRQELVGCKTPRAFGHHTLIFGQLIPFIFRLDESG